jgi:uncharacterized RDD family membrane protein YckC
VLGDVAIDVHQVGTVPTVQPAAVVTPEAVVLDLDRASVASRATAWVIDLAVIAFAFGVVALVGALVGAAVHAPDWAYVVVLVFAVFVLLFGYACVLESIWRGRTVGKKVMGLRVVTVDGAPIRFRHAALRAMLGLVDFWLPPGGATAILVSLGSEQDQRLGDLVAGTFVLHDRSVQGATAALWFSIPPMYEPFSASLDTSRLSNDDYRLARAFLVRTAELTPPARWWIGRQVFQRLATVVGVLPPPGMHHEWFVSCVVAAHQRRQLVVVTGPARPDGVSVSWPWARWAPAGAPALAAPAGPDDRGGFAAPG